MRRSALRWVILAWLLGGLLTLGLAAGDLHLGHDHTAVASTTDDHHHADKAPRKPQNTQPMGFAACVNGLAGPYPCQNVDLVALLPTTAMCGGVNGADLWGWTDPLDNREYAIMSHGASTSFVDLSDPARPALLGCLPAPSPNVLWRDVEIYNNHAYITGDAPTSSGALPHGVQIFDLTQLRSVPRPALVPVIFQETGRHPGGRIHTVTINQSTGFAYLAASEKCGRTLEIIDLKANPAAPTFAGCVKMFHPTTGAQLRTHEANCVTYNGPDTRFTGREICVFSNESALTVVDVTDKTFNPATRFTTNTVVLSNKDHVYRQYTHQSSFTGDMRYLLANDELDEVNYTPPVQKTRTYLWDFSSLTDIRLIAPYTQSTTCIDHQLFVKGRYVYQSNYTCGLRIFDVRKVAEGTLTQVGYFDTEPMDDAPNFSSAWGNYPFFKSGIVIVSDIEQGLFVLRPNLSK